MLQACTASFQYPSHMLAMPIIEKRVPCATHKQAMGKALDNPAFMLPCLHLVSAVHKQRLNVVAADWGGVECRLETCKATSVGEGVHDRT